MKKNWLLSAMTGILLAVLLFTGCTTVKIIASDATVPEADTAVVYPYSQKLGRVDGVTLTLKSLDGSALPKGFRQDGALRVPAGEHTFVADVKWYSGLTIVRADMNNEPVRQYFSAKKVRIACDFKAGESYYLEPVLRGGEGAKVTIPMFFGLIMGPKRVGGEPFIGQLAIYAVTQYDKKGLPVVAEDALIGVIGFDPEVSF